MLGHIDKITLRSLTTDQYGPSNEDPHVERIRPHSPIEVPAFAANLQFYASLARGKKMRNDSITEGLVLLSGPKDTYVDSPATETVLKKIAPKFKVIPPYIGALHEIDNEMATIRETAQAEILNFLEK